MKTWQEVECSPSELTLLHTELNAYLLSNQEEPLSELAVKHLVSIGITDVTQAVAFLHPQANQLHTPWEMQDMHVAVELLYSAIQSGKKITIASDYDADGITSTVIAYGALKQMGANVNYIVPHRVTDGYGLKASIVERCQQQGTELILTVDNGINAHEAITLAKSYGMTVIVTDHHLPSDELPCADAMVNPNRRDCRYPFKGICGAVVALKTMEALNEYRMERGHDTIRFAMYQQLACIGTIADVMPLHDENRYIVNRGLESIREKPLLGIGALLTALEIKPQHIEADTIAFYVAPCINATGRLKTADIAVNLLLSTNKIDAMVLAHECCSLNSERKGIQKAVLEKIQTTDDAVQVLLTDAHEGIVGLIAGQTVEKTGCPTIALTPSHLEGYVKGSGRSHSGYSLHDALEHISKQYPESFAGWGGHGVACGLTIKTEFVDTLRKELNDYFYQTNAHGLQKHYLGSVAGLELNDVVREFERMKPFGQGNKKPVFHVSGQVIGVSLFGGGLHQRIAMYHEGKTIELTHFKATEDVASGDKLSYFVTVGKSMWKGRPSIDALVEGKQAVNSIERIPKRQPCIDINR